MNVYKVSWVSKGAPHFLIAVAEQPGQVSSYVQSLDASNHIHAVETLYSDVQVIAAAPTAPASEPKEPKETWGQKLRKAK